MSFNLQFANLAPHVQDKFIAVASKDPEGLKHRQVQGPDEKRTNIQDLRQPSVDPKHEAGQNGLKR